MTVTLDSTGQIAVDSNSVDAISFDACGIAFYQLDVTGFTCADLGIQPVVMTVFDQWGNLASCAANITVQYPDFIYAKWLGLVDDDWFNAQNWDNGCIPQTDDRVAIPAGSPNNPVIAPGENVEIGTIEVELGAELIVEGILTIQTSFPNSLTDPGIYIIGGGQLIREK